MKIVVLGASGQIGSAIYNRLKDAHEVVGTSRSASERLLQFNPFSDDWSMLGKPAVLINCVGQIEPSAQSSFYHVHVALTKRILENRKQLGDPRIIQISALGSSANHHVEFLRTKGIADELLLQHPNTAVIRPSIVCTHRTMVVRKMILLSNLGRVLLGVVPVPKGFLHTRIQPIMPEDLVSLVQKACLENNVRMVDAVGPEEITFHEIIQMLMKSRNQKLRVIEVPKMVTDTLVKNFLSVVLPKVIDAQQYQLLFHHNTGNAAACEQLIGRSLQSTKEFFQQEFAHYAGNQISKSVKFLTTK